MLHILDLQSQSLYGEHEAPLIQHSGIFVSICSVFTSALDADRRAVMVVAAQGRLLWQKLKVSKWLRLTCSFMLSAWDSVWGAAFFPITSLNEQKDSRIQTNSPLHYLLVVKNGEVSTSAWTNNLSRVLALFLFQWIQHLLVECWFISVVIP